jgi:hypothetical protein
MNKQLFTLSLKSPYDRLRFASSQHLVHAITASGKHDVFAVIVVGTVALVSSLFVPPSL